MRLLLVISSILLCKAQEYKCPIDTSKFTAEELIADPPPGWDFECMNERLLNEALTTEAHALRTVECMENIDKSAHIPSEDLYRYPEYQCAGRGYLIIAEEIFRRVGEGARCQDCSDHINKIVQKAVQKMQRAYPKILRRGLRIMG